MVSGFPLIVITWAAGNTPGSISLKSTKRISISSLNHAWVGMCPVQTISDSHQGIRQGSWLELLVNTLIYRIGRAVIIFIQMLPLPLVARIGRAGGGLVFHLDARHRRVALKNLTMCFGREKSSEEISQI